MKFLFICTHNRCRSILSEAIMNHMLKGKFEARSAGSQPSGEVHPLTLKYLQEANIATEGLQSQSWDAFENWQPDVIVTVCDAAAGESCPTWFGDAVKLHWGLKDPSKVEGSEEEKAQAFRQTISEIASRTMRLASSQLDKLDPAALQSALKGLANEAESA